VPVPVVAVQVVVEPELEVAPSMNTAACPVEGDTNAGFRVTLCASAEGAPIVNVPLTCWTEAAALGLLLEPPPAQAESSAAVPMQAAA
jgi:hypothetical protein